DWIGHTEYSETRIEQLDHIFNLIGITWTGHEFLDAICSDTVWSKTKETFATKGLDMTFDLIKTVAGSVATSLLF
ncbi:DUF2513 domain-containing protein, partial [Aeromonas caviae]